MAKHKNKKNDNPAPDEGPALRFSPDAWAKLTWFCLRQEVEIGGFGISAPDDPLLIVDFLTVGQQADWASIEFEDEAVADFVDAQVDAGRTPDQFLRTWIHTHPGDSAQPSGTDERTFKRVFGTCDWAIMFILARTGRTYARLRFNAGPGGSVQLPVDIDWNHPFTGSDHEAWQAEYDANVHTPPRPALLGASAGGVLDDWDELGMTGLGIDVQHHPASDYELNAWGQLLADAGLDELDAAGATIAARWGLIDTEDWAEELLELPADQQRQFRVEVEELLAARGEVIADELSA